MATAMTRESDGKADYAVPRRRQAGRSRSPTDSQAALDDALAKLPIPKVMSYAGPGALLQRREVRAPGAPAGRAARRRRRAGDRARPDRRPHDRAATASWAAATIDIATADAYAPDARSRGQGDPVVRRAPRAIDRARPRRRPRRATRDRARRAARRGDRAGRMAGRLRRHLRPRVPRRAAGMPDPDDAAEPEVLRADRRGRQAARRASCVVSNLATARPAAIVAGNERVLRARLADAKFFFDQDRRQRLDAAAAEARERRLSQQARHAGRAHRATALARARASRRCRRRRRARRPRRAARQGRSRHRHGRRVPRAAGHDGPLLRAARRRAARGRRRDRAALLAALRGRRAARGPGRAGGRARRQARDARRHVRHRAGAHRRQGPVRAASRRRSASSASWSSGSSHVPLADAIARRVRRVRRRARGEAAPADRCSRPSCSTACAATCASGATAANQVEARDRATPADARRRCPTASPRCRRSRRCPRRPRSPPPTSASSTSCGSPAARPAHAVDPAHASPTAPSTTSTSRSSKLDPDVSASCDAGDFTAALKALATAKPVVDRFFDEVMVMADDPAVRANRLALLRGVAATMNRVADISKLAAGTRRTGPDDRRRASRYPGLRAYVELRPWSSSPTKPSPRRAPRRLIILDRDGVINHDSDQFIKSPDEWRPIPGQPRGDRAPLARRLSRRRRAPTSRASGADCSTWRR